MTPRTTLVLVGGHGFSTGQRAASDGSGTIPFPEPTPDAALVLYGQGIRRGVTLERAELVDITPTILALLDCPVAADMDGTVLREALAPEYLAAHPIGSVATYERMTPWERYSRVLTFFGEERAAPDSTGAAGTR
jgi:hypothetical protein